MIRLNKKKKKAKIKKKNSLEIYDNTKINHYNDTIINHNNNTKVNHNNNTKINHYNNTKINHCNNKKEKKSLMFIPYMNCPNPSQHTPSKHVPYNNFFQQKTPFIYFNKRQTLKFVFFPPLQKKRSKNY